MYLVEYLGKTKGIQIKERNTKEIRQQTNDRDARKQKPRFTPHSSAQLSDIKQNETLIYEET